MRRLAKETPPARKKVGSAQGRNPSRPEVTTHSFRKTVADLIDEGGGLSARVGADQLGHTHVSMTQDRYMSRGRIHAEVAGVLDRAVISAE